MTDPLSRINDTAARIVDRARDLAGDDAAASVAYAATEIASFPEIHAVLRVREYLATHADLEHPPCMRLNCSDCTRRDIARGVLALLPEA